MRQGRGDHEVWESPINGKRFTVDGAILSRHTVNGTLKEAGLPKQFWSATRMAQKRLESQSTSFLVSIAPPNLLIMPP